MGNIGTWLWWLRLRLRTILGKYKSQVHMYKLAKPKNGFSPIACAAAIRTEVLACCHVTFNFDLITKLSSAIKQIVGSEHNAQRWKAIKFQMSSSLWKSDSKWKQCLVPSVQQLTNFRLKAKSETQIIINDDEWTFIIGRSRSFK